MTKGIGIDIVEVKRIERKIQKPQFVDLVFTKNEQEYCASKKYAGQHFAARFAAKEAYMKALGLGWANDAQFKDIEIINNEYGQPSIQLFGDSLEYFKKEKLKTIFVSLSHTKELATAIVVIDF